MQTDVHGQGRKPCHAASVLVSLLVLSLFYAGPVRASLGVTVAVPARSGASGVDTGFDVTAGSQIQIEAIGYAEYGPDLVCGIQGFALTDPDGVRYIGFGACSPKRDPLSALPSAPVGALVGRIGLGPRFLIGSSAAITSKQSGRLFLLYNDVPFQYGDNLGSYNAAVSLISAPVGTGPNSARMQVLGLGGDQATLAPGQCVALDLEVRFTGNDEYVDVTRNANTQFMTDPPGGTITGNQVCLRAGDVNPTITVYGRYRDPGSGITVTGAVVLHVAPAASVHQTVEVPAARDLPGVDTGLDVVIGSRIQYTATGRAIYGPDVACGVSGQITVDPDGVRYPNGTVCEPKPDARAVLWTAPIGALLGRIDSGPWFMIGSSASITAAHSGRLYLLFNDVLGLYYDNRGSYSVSITAQ